MTWTRETVRSELRGLLTQHAQSGAPITDASHLVGDLGLDSLGVMEILADIEDKFKLNIPDEALREVETVADVAAAIEKRLESEGRLAG
ncbi:MAG: acyl carrier protein [Minicystis sp.]